MQFNSKVYDLLKKVAQIYLPAAGTLYFALAQIWNLPSPEEVTGTVVAVDTFLGVILGISSTAYNSSDGKYDGSMDISETDNGSKTIALSLNTDPVSFEGMKSVLFKVNVVPKTNTII